MIKLSFSYIDISTSVLIPFQFLKYFSSPFNWTSEGRTGVTKSPSFSAKKYPLPSDPVFGIAFDPVAITTLSASIFPLLVLTMKLFLYSMSLTKQSVIIFIPFSFACNNKAYSTLTAWLEKG